MTPHRLTALALLGTASIGCGDGSKVSSPSTAGEGRGTSGVGSEQPAGSAPASDMPPAQGVSSDGAAVAPTSTPPGEGVPAGPLALPDPVTPTTAPAAEGADAPAAGCPAPAAGVNPGRVCIKGKSYYLKGINVAWDQWTADLTNFNASAFEAMFAAVEAAGGNSVRWWWFIDGENQISFSGNLAQPLAQNIFSNLDAAFDSAAAHGILIMPVLLSFDLEQQGRAFLLTDPAATDAFVSNVVAPLVQRYDAHPALGLWEIMNEGDWLLTEEGGTVSTADYQRFHAKVAAGIHAIAPAALVTTGSASFKYLQGTQNILSDQALRAAARDNPLAHLDVFQTHYYSWMHGDGWSFEPWIQSSTTWQAAGKPIIVGEFPCVGEQGRWGALDMHVQSVEQGYAGSFCWAYFDNRSAADTAGTWADAEPSMRAIASRIPNAIAGE